MSRPIRWLLALMLLLLLPALVAAASGTGSRTMDYAWLLFLKAPVDVIVVDVIVVVGDSITEGFGDDDCVYKDAPQCTGYTGYGTTPPPPPNRLESLLAGAPGYDASLKVREKGVGGTTSTYGLSVIDGIISTHPAADMYLVMYGTNDADTPISKAVFKSNMAAIANKIHDAGMEPVLAKAPYAIGVDAYRNDAIRDYNAAIQELYVNTSYIKIAPPDFYYYFQKNTGQIWPYHMFTHNPEGVHPRSAGYDAMALCWKKFLTLNGDTSECSRP